MLCFNSTLAHLRQNVLYLYSLYTVYLLIALYWPKHLGGTLQTISDYSLFIVKFARLNTVCIAPLFLRLGTR